MDGEPYRMGYNLKEKSCSLRNFILRTMLKEHRVKRMGSDHYLFWPQDRPQMVSCVSERDERKDEKLSIDGLGPISTFLDVEALAER